MDARGRKMAERDVSHSGSGMEELLDWIQQKTAAEVHQVAVAIEVPRGAIVEALLERCYSVFSINPKQLDRFRDRHTLWVTKTTAGMRSCWQIRFELTCIAFGGSIPPNRLSYAFASYLAWSKIFNRTGVA
jgi:hypothetical protein